MKQMLPIAALLLATTAPALAQNSAPQPVWPVDTIPQARDIDYPGTLQLDIDATDTQRGIFNVKETIPVAKSGHMVLLFPKWLPGAHTPRGEIEKLAGLQIRANGKRVPWTRDPMDVFAFHVEVPAGAKALNLEFQFISATVPDQGRMVMTPNMLSLQWNSMSLYPAGYFTRRIPVQATVKYPTGWSAAAGLPSKATGSTYTYDKTTYEILVDSPVLAGRYYKPFELSPRVTLDVFADSPEELEAKPEQIEAHKRLVEQAVKTFGTQHYDHYHFLLSISEELGGIGLEHHRSSEDGVRPGYFTKWEEGSGSRNLLPHEYTHSWDGKFRRGADLWTPDFRTPMRDSLLWVYEGQTQFWGYVFQARSGLVSKEDTLEGYAAIMASLDNRPARQWRPLVDTTNDPIISSRRPKGWVSWQRSEDYYNEGLLVWMDVDSILREQSHGTKSIDDFARSFFGYKDGDFGEVTYTLDDVIAELNRIVPYDWKGFLDERLNAVTERAPLNGFTRNGYKLVYTDVPNKSGRGGRDLADLTYSLGLTAGPRGISNVTWDSPAFNAGMDLGDEIVAVNGMSYTGDRLKDAVKAAKGTKDPIKLLLKSGDRFREVSIDYHEGLRYPHLVKTVEGEAGLDKLLQPR
ncbi:peptidase M61 [Sphingomonas sp. dw_22]|uniref:M61 family metallopeptidase n=1 Tax=Sphingomonas sp. dw_22 TaxID=2721175 RepID=UPI001BD519B7|nr:peptidase M61 [Sphingomonas sp. dw_22]